MAFSQVYKCDIYCILVETVNGCWLKSQHNYVDRNMKLDKSVSQLSLGVFIAPRNLLVHQKSFIYAKIQKASKRCLKCSKIDREHSLSMPKCLATTTAWFWASFLRKKVLRFTYVCKQNPLCFIVSTTNLMRISLVFKGFVLVKFEMPQLEN